MNIINNRFKTEHTHLPETSPKIQLAAEMLNKSYKYFKIITEHNREGDWLGFFQVPTENEYIKDFNTLKANKNLQDDKISELIKKHSNLLNEELYVLLGRESQLSTTEQLSHYPDQIWLLLQKSQEENYLVTTPHNGCHALHYAAAIGNLDGITAASNLIVNQSHSELNTFSKQGETPLSIAIRFGQHEAVKLLIQLEVDINKKVRSVPPLHHALRAGDVEMVKLLSKQPDINLLAVDSYQRTALHEAHCTQPPNKEIIDYLSSLPDFKEISSSAKDIFGFTIAVLEENGFTDINQVPVVNKLRQYLKMNNRNTEMLPTGVQCNGFGFLAQYYTAIGKCEAFYKVMQLFAEWDETERSLKDPETIKELTDVYGLDYSNLGDLMEQWINDIVWFTHKHHLYGSGYETMGSGGQSLRKEQFESVKPKKLGLSLHMIEDPTTFQCTKDLLIEKIQECQEKPGTIFECGSAGHRTSGQVLEKRKLFYYDSEFPSKVKLFDSAAELAQVIIDTKYEALGEPISPSFILEFMTYCFEKEA